MPLLRCRARQGPRTSVELGSDLRCTWLRHGEECSAGGGGWPQAGQSATGWCLPTHFICMWQHQWMELLYRVGIDKARGQEGSEIMASPEGGGYGLGCKGLKQSQGFGPGFTGG